MESDLANIRFVLCEPSHPGNVGAVARAMKTMGVGQLALVNPNRFPSADATANASGADDLLTEAQIVDTLAEALSGVEFVVATSARSRHVDLPGFAPREAAARIMSRAATGRVAVVFGRERTGLSNAELRLCHERVQIPTRADFSSLNLAQAVQVIAYELRLAAVEAVAPDTVRELADVSHVDSFFEHLEKVLWDVKFLVPAQSDRMLQRIHRLFMRAEMDTTEINILRGALSAVERSIDRK